MRIKVLILCACASMLIAGCSTFSGGRGLTASRPVGRGTKLPDQVAPCCRDLALGRITLDQCMENPACKANNRACCMNAI